MATYHPTECIFDLLAAQGPQETSDMMQELKQQVPGFPEGQQHWPERVALLRAACAALISAGIVESDDGWYELTGFGYGLVRAWNECDVAEAEQYTTEAEAALEARATGE